MPEPKYTERAAALHVPAHREHCAAGHCPSVSPSKNWCVKPPAHPGPHFAPYIDPAAGPLSPAPLGGIQWLGSEWCPCQPYLRQLEAIDRMRSDLRPAIDVRSTMAP